MMNHPLDKKEKKTHVYSKKRPLVHREREKGILSAVHIIMLLFLLSNNVHLHLLAVQFTF